MKRDEESEAMAKDYRSGASMAELVSKYRMHHNQIKRRLIEEGCEIRKRGYQRPEVKQYAERSVET